jgi:hypothetical protein
MYDTPRYEQGFRDGVNGIIEAVMNNATSKNETEIPYPCKDCNNNLQLGDMCTIRVHLITRRFVKDYIVWIHHGEAVGDDLINDDVDIRYMDACVHELDSSIGGHGQAGSSHWSANGYFPHPSGEAGAGTFFHTPDLLPDEAPIFSMTCGPSFQNLCMYIPKTLT